MNPNEIKQILIKELNLDKIIINKNNNHVQIIVISDIFIGISQVKRQQIIYAPLMKYIINNQIHALSIQTYTMKEWIINHKI